MGTTANKQSKLVYFCQQVDHKKLKKIIKSKKEKERLKQELIEISLEKIVPNTTLSPK
ncbi:MAG: hypothetical protein HWD59_00085 [Coxiellaceae bacterium]|nr:MAG: hypothetical protein HWD59_00085 [Coxiellaceae bacterium]